MSKARNMPLRVLLVGDYPPPHGGVSVHVAALLEALRASGAQGRVLDIGESGRRGVARADRAILPSGGPLRFAALLGAYAAMGWTLHAHTSGANPKSWLLAIACAAIGGARRGAVLTLHSGLAPAYLAATPAARRAARLAALGCARILCASPAVARALVDAGVAPWRVQVAPAFAPRVVRPGEPPLLARAHRAQHRPLVCAAVGPTPTYGAETLLRAFVQLRSRLPFAGLCLYGEGSDSPVLSALAHEARVASAVALLGEVPHAQALGIVASADLFVRPTTADGDALSVREALALGRRVVATNVGQRPPGVVLCSPGDPLALAEAMVRALQAEAPRPSVEPHVDGVEAALEAYRGLQERHGWVATACDETSERGGGDG